MNESNEFFKVTMFFPLTDNDGNLFDEHTWGWWHGHSDQNRWILAVVGSEEEVGQLRNFVKRAKKWFRQNAMYFEWHTVHFELVK
jgi:hypothetical protein